MLSYAFHVLNEKGYNKIATEDFENTADLFSEILINAVGKQIKQGLYKDYIPFDETVTSIKGKMNIKKYALHPMSFLHVTDTREKVLCIK